MKPASGDDKKHPKRRDSALPPELRDLEKLVLALAEEFSFAGEKFEPLKKKTAGMIGAWRQREAGYRAEHHTSRAYLNGLTNGGVERWIAGSGNADMQQHFRRVWRDARTAPDADAPMKHIPLSPTPVEAQGKAAATAAAVAPNTTVTDASRLEHTQLGTQHGKFPGLLRGLVVGLIIAATLIVASEAVVAAFDVGREWVSVHITAAMKAGIRARVIDEHNQKEWEKYQSENKGEVAIPDKPEQPEDQPVCGTNYLLQDASGPLWMNLRGAGSLLVSTTPFTDITTVDSFSLQAPLQSSLRS